MARKKIDTSSLFTGGTDSQDKKSITKPAVSALVNPEEKTVQRVQAIELHIDTKVIRPWSLHDRDDSKLNEDDCADIIESIKAIGQKDPIKVRPLVNDPDGYQYEIIKGRRRTFACGVLGKKVLARAEDMNDQAAWLEMDSENDDRKDISEMERAKSYVEALKAGLFESAAELATLRGKPRAHVSKFTKAAKILELQPFMNMVCDFTTIPVMPAYKLMTSIDGDKNKSNYELTIKRLSYLRETKKALTAAQIIKDLNGYLSNKNSTKAAVDSPDNYAAVKGDVMVISAKREKGGIISMNVDSEQATAAELKKAFAETLKKLGIK